MEQTHPSPAPSDRAASPPLPAVAARAYGLIGIAAASLLAAATVSAARAADDDHGSATVSQHHRQFSPNHVVIRRGSVVHIINDDKVTHHVFIDTPGMSFDSGEQPVGKTVDLQFDKSGTFPVQCAIHPTMRLEITVE
jgi:plastocyanin